MKYYDDSYFEKRDVLIPHLAQTIKKIAKKHRLKNILDVGCGTGRLVKFLQKNGFQAVGVDNSKKAVKKARALNNLKTISFGSADKLHFKDQSFDLITSISVIEHLTPNQAKEFIIETRRILKPGGFLFLVTPNYATPLRIISGKNWFAYKDPTHINFYSPASLTSLLRKNGFDNFRCYFKISWQESLEWEFPGMLGFLPLRIKKLLVYLIFASPLAIIRNSFWMLAQKNE